MNNTTFYPVVETDLNAPDSRPNDNYPGLEQAIRFSWDAALMSKDPIFFTNCNNLYDIFLNNLPVEARNHYNCNACRNFINRYGNLVRVDEDGVIHPAMLFGSWPSFFTDSLRAMDKAISNSKITHPFITSEKRLGIPKTGIWSHMAVDVPRDMRWADKLKTADQRMSELKQDHEILWNAISKYSVDTVKTAVNLLSSNSLFRSEKFIAQARWFLDILEMKSSYKSTYRNLIWRRVVKAPAGYCHVPGSTLGSLLDDIQEGMDFDTIKNRFNAKVDPLRYQRPQVAPAAQNVARAEKIVAELGLTDSLRRRYARLDEIQTIWKPTAKKVQTTTAYGIFGHLKTKDSTAKRTSNDISAPATTMTWDKFCRTVLPNAKKIEYKSSQWGTAPYAAILTAADMDAPPIIAWDRDDERNPFSWYLYANGSAGRTWNLSTGWTEVTGIAKTPNLWGDGFEHYVNGAFLILKDCRDTNNNIGLGLFPEMLRGELREVRSTIEAYSKNGELEGADEASACGVMLTSNYRSLTWINLRVTTDVGVQKYKIDRWD